MWDFSVEPEFAAKLEWAAEFVRDECEALDVLYPGANAMYDTGLADARAALAPLRDRVREQGLWACHLGPELGGPGYGQVRLALLNEILGRSWWAPTVFGTAAPDTGNAEILAMFGTDEQKARYLQPLLVGDIVSSFSMTEPHAGADPKEFTCRAWPDGDEWVIDGEKWFTSNARFASFLIVMVVTDPDAPPHERMSMFVVPSDAPGLHVLDNVALMGENDEDGTHAHLHYDHVRVPADAMLGERGRGFDVAQARLGGGRVHHAMRTVGRCQRVLDMMGERALSRRAQGSLLADKQFVQGFLADSAIALQQLRLLVMYTAWVIDTQPHGAARQYIAMCKVAMAETYQDIVRQGIQLHGSLGTTIDTPLARMWADVLSMALADGPTEVHKVTVARQLLRGYRPAPGLFPSEHIPSRRVAELARRAAAPVSPR